ncbi:ATP-binding protein [Hymenobacter sp. BRD128]|uniref:ATP-binding protein n=1 Tax=Hymenobacter sp. BRD128 TaxID=2675878 RepID=UPI0015643118|nr:ATP-binding protein [Hymenobacter sp. BRD128]QKG57674.1 ATP-binding protein [Hymenobacter sp. BRD128]
MQDRIRISCSRQNLQQVRDFVRGFLLSAKRNDLLVNQVVLAVDEVVANFIIHANGEDATQFLDLLLVLADQHLDIEIEDHGNTLFLPPGKVPNPDLRAYIQQGRKGGMGMALVSRIMDQVEFFERNSHTVCHLSKTLI